MGKLLTPTGKNVAIVEGRGVHPRKSRLGDNMWWRKVPPCIRLLFPGQKVPQISNDGKGMRSPHGGPPRARKLIEAVIISVGNCESFPRLRSLSEPVLRRRNRSLRELSSVGACVLGRKLRRDRTAATRVSVTYFKVTAPRIMVRTKASFGPQSGALHEPQPIRVLFLVSRLAWYGSGKLPACKM